MKSSVLVLCVVIIFSTAVNAQNLVPNGSFEEGITCPSFIGSVTEECADWYASLIHINPDLNPTPDWFHTCSEIEAFTPPEIAFGFQVPADGDGYVGLINVTMQQQDYRETIGVALIEPLNIGDLYFVNFKVSLVSNPGNAIYSNNIGFNFSTHPYYNEAQFPINTSHFAVDTIIPLTDDWTLISEEFVADSTYGYFHIGNFYDDANTDTLLSGLSSYFIVDEVSIFSTLNTDDTKTKGYKIFPNPSGRYINIQFNIPQEKFEYTIYSVHGVMLLTGAQVNSASQIEIDISSVSSGYYILEISTQRIKSHETIIKL
jgi:hypothetical protein